MTELTLVLKAKDKASKILDDVVGKVGLLGPQAVVGAAIGGLAALGGGIAFSVGQAQEFEKEMDRVVALTGLSGEAAEEANGKLTALAKELGGSTSFTAAEAAEGMQFLSMAGFDVNDTMAAMPGLLAAAAAGQTDLATTSDIVSNVLSGFNIEATETGNVADVLTATFTSSNTSLQSLGESMKFAAPAASQLGVSIQESAALIGKMGDAGIQGSMAGTSLRTTLLRLASGAGGAGDTLADLGVKTTDSTGAFRPMNDILDDLNASMADYTQSQKLAAMESIVGKNAVSGFAVMLQSAADGSLPTFIEQLDNAGGTAEQVANQQLANLSGQTTLLRSALDGVAVGIGESLLPMLTDLVTSFTGLVQTHGPAVIEIFSQFADNLSATVGPAMMIIQDSMSRIAVVFGSTTGDVSAMDAVLWLLKAVLDAVVIGLQAFAIIMETLATNFENMKLIIGALIDPWQGFQDLVANFKLPAVLTPGSPTPFELGLQGISTAMQNVIGLGQAFLGALNPGGIADSVKGMFGMGGSEAPEGEEAAPGMTQAFGDLLPSVDTTRQQMEMINKLALQTATLIETWNVELEKFIGLVDIAIPKMGQMIGAGGPGGARPHPGGGQASV